MSRLRGKHGDRTVAGVSLGYEDEYSVRFTGRGLQLVVLIEGFYVTNIQTAR